MNTQICCDHPHLDTLIMPALYIEFVVILMGIFIILHKYTNLNIVLKILLTYALSYLIMYVTVNYPNILTISLAVTIVMPFFLIFGLFIIIIGYISPMGCV